MVNVPGTFEHRNIYAIETAPAAAIEVLPPGGLNNPPRFHPTNTTWRLFLIDGNGGCNAFEATAKFTACGQTLFYAGGTTDVFTNKDDVLTVFDSLSWTENIGGMCTVQQVIHQYPVQPPNPPVPTCP